jgi:hypothetical protein
MNASPFELKHSMRPYALVLILLFAIGLLALWVGFAKNDWGAFYVMVAAVVIYLLKIYFYDLHYSIFFKDGSIVMQGANWIPNPKDFTSIKVADITSIKRETSDLRTLAAQRRASQRIAIYDENHQKFIDVSLKHFTQNDVRKLMQIIHDHRPDLTIPNGWV